MTVLINGTVDVKAEDRAAALAAAAALIPDTRSQKGCNHYAWCADPTSDTRIYVYENWASSEDLSAHLSGPYFAQMLGVLGQFGVLDTAISKFKISVEEPVFDPQGNPRGDFFTA